MTRLLAVAALALVACGAPEPPRFYSIDSDFAPQEQETIRAAIDAWCSSDAQSCPEEVGWAEYGRFVLVDNIEELVPNTITAGRNPGDGRVLIARNRPAPDDLGLLFNVSAHEWGHFCIDGHPVAGGLMAQVHRDNEGVLTVDDEAVRAWREGCAL